MKWTEHYVWQGGRHSIEASKYEYTAIPRTYKRRVEEIGLLGGGGKSSNSYFPPPPLTPFDAPEVIKILNFDLVFVYLFRALVT